MNLTSNTHRCSISKRGRISIPVTLQKSYGIFDKKFCSMLANSDSGTLLIRFYDTQKPLNVPHDVKVLKFHRANNSTAYIEAGAFLRKVRLEFTEGECDATQTHWEYNILSDEGSELNAIVIQFKGGT